MKNFFEQTTKNNERVNRRLNSHRKFSMAHCKVNFRSVENRINAVDPYDTTFSRIHRHVPEEIIDQFLRRKSFIEEANRIQTELFNCPSRKFGDNLVALNY